MWLSTDAIKNMKDLGYSFEEIEDISARLERVDNWTEKLLSWEEFWWEVYKNINSKMKAQCIK
jgi:hypothetical protein